MSLWTATSWQKPKMPSKPSPIWQRSSFWSLKFVNLFRHFQVCADISVARWLEIVDRAYRCDAEMFSIRNAVIRKDLFEYGCQWTDRDLHPKAEHAEEVCNTAITWSAKQFVVLLSADDLFLCHDVCDVSFQCFDLYSSKLSGKQKSHTDLIWSTFFFDRFLMHWWFPWLFGWSICFTEILAMSMIWKVWVQPTTWWQYVSLPIRLSCEVHNICGLVHMHFLLNRLL